jgi:hypothetical protein
MAAAPVLHTKALGESLRGGDQLRPLFDPDEVG